MKEREERRRKGIMIRQTNKRNGQTIREGGGK
jgi:hypothetical protein